MRSIDPHRLAMLDTPACQPDSERAAVGEDFVRPLVASPHGDQETTRLVGLVDGQRVVRNELGQCIRDPVQQCVEALLGEHIVEDVRQAPVRLDARGPLRRIGEEFQLDQPEWESMVAHRQGWIRLYSRSGAPFSEPTHSKAPQKAAGIPRSRVPLLR